VLVAYKFLKLFISKDQMTKAMLADSF